jgi:DNA-binding GntR family transcriptional regulator
MGTGDEVNHRNVMPVYRQVAALLGARIAGGEFPPGRLLPSERELAAQYRVAVGTIRHALQLLREEGLIVTEPGRGSGANPDMQKPRPPS